MQLISGEATTKYHYDSAGRLIAISDASGNWSETVWLGDLPVAQVSGSNVYAIHSDQVGQPVKMSNASGALVWQRTAQPFGETYAESGSIATVLRFPGQVADAATATHYNMARDYDPTLGRYLQSDPIGLAGGWNTYSYVGNNPLRYTDPTGEFVPLAILGGIAVGTGSELAIQAGMNWWNGRDVFDPDCYEWGEVALAGGLGAFGGAWTKSAVRLTAGSMKWKNVSRRIRRAEGMIGNPEEQLHHWAITQKMAKKLRLPDGLVNRPWNLNRVPTDFHTRLHNMNPLFRTARGAPRPVQAAGLLGAAGAAGEMADGGWE